jgi:hypothetical protein
MPRGAFAERAGRESASPMPTRDQVTELLGAGESFEGAGRALGIPPGQAYMIATGRPADDGGGQSPTGPAGTWRVGAGSQQLVNPPAVNPIRDETILAWVRERAARELTREAR